MSSIGVKNSQQLVQHQKLVLTQDLQLFLRLIQMTALDLKDYLEEQLEQNPVLEEETEAPASANSDYSLYKEDHDFKSGSGGNSTENMDSDVPHFRDFIESADEGVPWESRLSAPESFLDYLEWQLNLSDFSPEDKEIAALIIKSLNDDGYLDGSIEDIALHFIARAGAPSSDSAELSEEEKARAEEVLCQSDGSYVLEITRVLRKIQSSFDPPGVCARDLTECLKIQAEELGYRNGCVLMNIIESHIQQISTRDYKLIADSLGCSPEEAEQAALVIASFEPKPGRPFFSNDSERHIVPDFYIYRVGDELQIQPNRAFPQVKVSNRYKSIVAQGKSLAPDVRKYVREKMEAAQRIVKCLEEREATIKKVMAKIVEVQRDFFDHGRDYIKPLRLKDVASVVGVHESTVSRITSRRYIYTPNVGVVELKIFFSRKIETSHGGDISFERVKALMNDIVASEPGSSPYSDEDISKILQRKNIVVARRTVSKYRKLLNIPSSSERQKEVKR
ncbi:MAG: RNA polymerase factor sigma-54 [Deltaproteobacteria bacterium]